MSAWEASFPKPENPTLFHNRTSSFWPCSGTRKIQISLFKSYSLQFLDLTHNSYVWFHVRAQCLSYPMHLSRSLNPNPIALYLSIWGLQYAWIDQSGGLGGYKPKEIIAIDISYIIGLFNCNFDLFNWTIMITVSGESHRITRFVSRIIRSTSWKAQK